MIFRHKVAALVDIHFLFITVSLVRVAMKNWFQIIKSFASQLINSFNNAGLFF